MKIREYQKQILSQAYSVCKEHGFVYLALEMRLGKTLISLILARALKARSVLFLTKKKAISSIEADYQTTGYDYDFVVTNYEQVKNLGSRKWDVVIVDEAHSFAAFPKPSLRTKEVREIIGEAYVVFLSGTPSPESYSQLYHQFWLLGDRSPFAEWKSFYKWAAEFVRIRERLINGVRIRDYSKADRTKVWSYVRDYFIVYTQKEAGFSQEVKEHVLEIPVNGRIYDYVKELTDERLLQIQGRVILADTPVKLQSKIHQIFSGTVIDEEGNGLILDETKAWYIEKRFKGHKIAVYYKFQAEFEVLSKVFAGRFTLNPEEFNESGNEIVFLSQIQSGSMGVDLRAAEFLVMYNIDFSAVQYWQVRNRMQSKDREKEAVIVWIFAQNGIESKVLEAVVKKKDYNVSYFKRDFLTKEDRSGYRKTL